MSSITKGYIINIKTILKNTHVQRYMTIIPVCYIYIFEIYYKKKGIMYMLFVVRRLAKLQMYMLNVTCTFAESTTHLTI